MSGQMVDGAEVMPLADRLALLRETSPAADIVTEIIRFSDHGCLVAARIVEPDQEADNVAVITSCAHGWAADPETAEDRAISRALAHAGYGTVALLEAPATAPVAVMTPPAASPPEPGEDSGAPLPDDANLTRDLVDRLRQAQRKHRWEDGRCMHWVRQHCGNRSIVTGDVWSSTWEQVICELNVGQARQLAVAMRTAATG